MLTGNEFEVDSFPKGGDFARRISDLFSRKLGKWENIQEELTLFTSFYHHISFLSLSYHRHHHHRYYFIIIIIVIILSSSLSLLVFCHYHYRYYFIIIIVIIFISSSHHHHYPFNCTFLSTQNATRLVTAYPTRSLMYINGNQMHRRDKANAELNRILPLQRISERLFANAINVEQP